MKIDFDSLRALMMENRTVRRFIEDRIITRDTLEKLVELTRYCASGRNAQPLKYVIVDDEVVRREIYPALKWAGYYTDWDGPEEGERPSAYIIQCLDTKYGNDCLCDDGLQLEAMTLGMHTLGLAGCIIKAFNLPLISEILNLEQRFVPRYVLALGYPAEEVRIEDIEDDDFKYYRTPDGVHHVPKRGLSELLLN